MAISDQARQLLRPGAAWVLLWAAAGLTAVGVFAIATVDPAAAAKQTEWVFTAMACMVLCLAPHPRHIGLIAFGLMGVCIFLLAILLAPGVPTWFVHPINGARCWMNLGLMSFEPSEVAKVAFVLALARYLRYRDNYRRLSGLLVPFLLMLVPVVLILKQPDLGMALLFVPTLFVVLVAAGAKLRHLSALVAVGVVAMAVNVAVIAIDPPRIGPSGAPQPASAGRTWMHLLKPHQEARIAALVMQFQNDPRYEHNIGYQQRVAKQLAGAGGVEGYGAARSAVIFKANYLPENHNDMIFTVIVNRWGFLGGAGVIMLYLVMVCSLLALAGRAKDPFSRLTCVGFAGLIFTQAAINIGMNIGLVPITGITLPFVSYGGSSLLVTFGMVGLVLNFASRRPSPLARPSFEFDQSEAVYQ